MAKVKARKDPFMDLPEEFKDAIVAMDAQTINLRIAEIAKNEQENQELKKEDEHLNDLKAQVTDASAGYKEATKQNKLKIKFARQVLKDKGAVSRSSQTVAVSPVVTKIDLQN